MSASWVESYFQWLRICDTDRSCTAALKQIKAMEAEGLARVDRILFGGPYIENARGQPLKFVSNGSLGVVTFD